MTKSIGAVVFMAAVVLAVLAGYLEWKRAEQMNRIIEAHAILDEVLKRPASPMGDSSPRWQSPVFLATCGISLIGGAFGFVVMLVGKTDVRR